MGAQASCLLDLPIGPRRITTSTSFDLLETLCLQQFKIQNSKFFYPPGYMALFTIATIHN
jgi:hypothetical protein